MVYKYATNRYNGHEFEFDPFQNYFALDYFVCKTCKHPIYLSSVKGINNFNYNHNHNLEYGDSFETRIENQKYIEKFLEGQDSITDFENSITFLEMSCEEVMIKNIIK